MVTTTRVCNRITPGNSILVTRDRHNRPLNRFELFLAMCDGREVALKDSRGNVIKGRIASVGKSDSSDSHLDLRLQTRQGRESVCENVLALTAKGDGSDDDDYP